MGNGQVGGDTRTSAYWNSFVSTNKKKKATLLLCSVCASRVFFFSFSSSLTSYRSELLVFRVEKDLFFLILFLFSSFGHSFCSLTSFIFCFSNACHLSQTSKFLISLVSLFLPPYSPSHRRDGEFFFLGSFSSVFSYFLIEKRGTYTTHFFPFSFSLFIYYLL